MVTLKNEPYPLTLNVGTKLVKDPSLTIAFTPHLGSPDVSDTFRAICSLAKRGFCPCNHATVRRTTEEINDVKASLSYFVAVSIERGSASGVCSGGGGGNVASGRG